MIHNTQASFIAHIRHMFATLLEFFSGTEAKVFARLQQSTAGIATATIASSPRTGRIASTTTVIYGLLQKLAKLSTGVAYKNISIHRQRKHIHCVRDIIA